MSDVEALADHGRQLQIYVTSWVQQHEEIVARMKRSLVDTGCVVSARQAGVPQTAGATAGAIQAHSDGSVVQLARNNQGPAADCLGGSALSTNSVPLDGIRQGLSFMKGSFQGVARRNAAPGGRLRSVVESPLVDAICATIIIGNAVFMAFASDYAIDSVMTGAGDYDSIIQTVELAFTAWYVVELALRIAAFGHDFLFGTDWKWNLFDAAVVLAGVYDQCVQVFGSYFERVFNASFLRLLRIAKMVKMLRLVRAFMELRMVLALVLGSCSSMVWASALLTVVLFLFSVCFIQGVTQHLADHEISNETRDVLLLYWGSVGTSMNSLFSATTGGDSWSLMAGPSWDVGFVYYALFLFYLMFFFFSSS